MKNRLAVLPTWASFKYFNQDWYLPYKQRAAYSPHSDSLVHSYVTTIVFNQYLRSYLNDSLGCTSVQSLYEMLRSMHTLFADSYKHENTIIIMPYLQTQFQWIQWLFYLKCGGFFDVRFGQWLVGNYQFITLLTDCKLNQWHNKWLSL